MDWKDLPPTEKQIQVLRRNHYPVPKTRGECSILITHIIRQSKKIGDYDYDELEGHPGDPSEYGDN